MAQVRWTRLVARTASPVAVLAALPSVTVDPLATVEFTAQVLSGEPDSYGWRIVSGPATISSEQVTAAFVAPADLNGTTVVVGVRPVTDDAEGAEVTATVTVRPHTLWLREAGVIVPAKWVEAQPL